jgi:flagellar assembly factor FliW
LAAEIGDLGIFYRRGMPGATWPETEEPMQTLEPAELETIPVRKENIIHFPLGLLGFERIKKYVLLSEPDDAPFHWLQVLDDPNLAFLVLSPFEIMPDYAPDIDQEVVEFLKLASSQDALVFNIVTLHPNGHATINLRGPIILNRHTLVGKQVVPTNAALYSLQHPLSALE